MATQVQIVNVALGRLGVKPIVTMAESTAPAIRATAIWDIVRQSVLRDHFWGFATQPIELVESSEDDEILNWGYVYLYPTGCLSVEAVYAEGDDEPQPFKKYLMSGGSLAESFTSVVIGAETVYCPGAWSLTISGTWVGTVKLQSSIDAGVTWVDVESYTANETDTGTIAAPGLFRLNCTARASGTIVCALTISDYLVLACDLSSDAYAEYISDVDDTTLFDSGFVDALAWRLAAELSQSLTGSASKGPEMVRMYGVTLDLAKADDANEGHQDPDPDQGNPYYDAR